MENSIILKKGLTNINTMSLEIIDPWQLLILKQMQ